MRARLYCPPALPFKADLRYRSAAARRSLPTPYPFSSSTPIAFIAAGSPESRSGFSSRMASAYSPWRKYSVALLKSADAETLPSTGAVPCKPSAFEETLKQALTADARRPRQERRAARAPYAEFKVAGHIGGDSRVTDFIRAWRQGEGQSVSVNAFVPLLFEVGEAFRFDWSEEVLAVGGIAEGERAAAGRHRLLRRPPERGQRGRYGGGRPRRVT